MAPEVLSKGTTYDSSADWFSFGCVLYKLLKGHSPFRQHKIKDKNEIDRMTLTMVGVNIVAKFGLICIYLFALSTKIVQFCLKLIYTIKSILKSD